MDSVITLPATAGAACSPRDPADPHSLRENRIVMGLRNDPRADVFRVLRTQILRQLRENHWNCFAVASATPGAGKTFVALNVAIAMAREGNQKVLLVDADLRRPQLIRYLGLKPPYGLVDYLQGSAELDEIFMEPGFPGLSVIPGRAVGDIAPELISSAAMARLVREIQIRFEKGIVIFDIPPLFVADDFLLLARYLDGAVLVVEDGQNTPEELRDSLHMLEHTHLLGVILNKASKPMGRMYAYAPLPPSD